jgi:hypothetical protein
VHEFGHVIGLLHPCEFDTCDAPSTVMMPFFDDVDASLRDDDIAGVCALYQSTNCDDCAPTPPPPALCVGDCGAMGDPCGDDLECASTACAHGLCSSRCDSRACPGGWECGSDTRCHPSSGQAFGSPCESGFECTSGVCVLVDAVGLCSRRCTASCPSGFECTSIDSGDYCAPAVVPSTGCAATNTRRSPGIVATVSVCLLGLISRGRRRGFK